MEILTVTKKRHYGNNGVNTKSYSNKSLLLRTKRNIYIPLDTSSGNNTFNHIQKEHITMVNYKKELEIQLKELDSLLAKVSKNQKGYKGLEPGKLRVTSSHGIPQYRFVKDGSSCAQYLPAIEKEKPITGNTWAK